jgi:hypothetical protein
VGRAVYPFEPTWLDKNFRKALKKLRSAEDREQILAQIEALLDALGQCRHPIQDPNLSRWHPTPYRGLKIPRGNLVEYRFPNLIRVVVCDFPGGVGGSREPTLLLLGVTLHHDHDRLMRLFKQHKKGIGKWRP